LFPIDLLLLQGFPVHRMRFPYSLSARDLAKLAGNTMHLKCVGLALAIGILLTRADLAWQAACKASRPGSELERWLDPTSPSETMPETWLGPRSTDQRENAET